ncbi:MAG: class I SAM-dependent methyltransferase, partial [Armatimonadetes bacterium]|nr:class I SAM-dependent methyltransferase [Anaerolineae bacterium]
MSDSSIAFDQAASYYDDTRGFPPGIDREVGAFIANAGGLDANSQVLEIGIGTGRIALPLAAHVGGIVGVDLAIPMMQRLRHKRQAYAGRIDLIQGDILQLPLADASFDAGLMVHILHLVPDPQQAVRELARVLKP